MIKRRNEQEIEVRENMRGGPGQVAIRHYFRRDEINAPCRLCAQLVIPPGAGIGPHEHINEDEIFIILQGRGIVDEAGEEVVVETGDSILTGRGASHSIRNIGEIDLLVIAIIIRYSS